MPPLAPLRSPALTPVPTPLSPRERRSPDQGRRRVARNPWGMAAYDDQGGDEYYVDDPAGSFEQDLVCALDDGVRHTVNQALAHAIRPIKHHLIGFAELQGWVAPSGTQALTEPSLSGSSQALKQGNNPHAADFESLIRSLARDHDYNTSSSQKSKSKNDLASSSPDHSSDRGDDPPRKRKKNLRHQEEPRPAPKVHTFEPEDIVYPRSSLWLPPAEVADYMESHIRHGFEKEVRSRLCSECPRPDFPSKVAETPELDPTLVTYLKKFSKDPKKGIDRAWRGCQDKLLDVTGPLTKILELGFQAKDSVGLLGFSSMGHLMSFQPRYYGLE
ncbi:hypothetical protein NDU88_001520 [Pleurodeles waltl]|uniref:Uncharacterized protein n=1 Tax=Pleurodeles waltl TaxID=8319 RepID=A0AAV7WIN9_PLEWA|nr:hypothetical protein NDU88_001520 [Pleurodeles waltl]